MPKPTSTTITCEADIARGTRALTRKCDVARRVHVAVGTPPLRLQPPGFEGLARIVVGQQLSVASAAAIWGRCQKKIRPMTPDRMMRTRETTCKALGLSAGKIKTLKAAAHAIQDGALDLDAADLDDTTLREQLIAVHGIGPWTADIYLMFSLGRSDAFAPGDLALQIGAQYAFGCDARPSPDDLTDLVETWRPWRAVGARMLWAYYAHVKNEARSGAPSAAAGSAVPV